MNGTPLLLAIIGHLVGDYLLQNDWMAMNKKRDSLPCFVHCALWTLSVCLFAGWYQGWPFVFASWILFATHFAIDHTNIVMRWMCRPWGQEHFATGSCAPWSIIVVDNTWHILTIWFVWRFIV